MTIDARTVMLLRERTGAGIMDCKEALKTSNGDMDKAIECLRKKGIAKAEKKAGRKVNHGAVTSYIHPGNRIGVLVEVNCETDFVAKTNQFLRFVHDIAMQIAATNPKAIKRENLDKVLIEREKEIYKEQAKATGKPEQVIEKIAEGRMGKFYQEVCLLEQVFIKDNEKTIHDLVNETIASLGENIEISQFSRFEVGESASTNGEEQSPLRK